MIVAATIVVDMTKEEATVEEVCFVMLKASYVFKRQRSHFLTSFCCYTP